MIFELKESIKLIGRAKSSFILSLISTSIAVLLIAASVILIKLSNEFQSSITESININLFIKEGLDSGEIEDIKQKLQNYPAINKIIYIDKETAAENFIKETGEDFRKILDYNPLPASFNASIKREYFEKDSLNRIITSIESIAGVDEVIFQHETAHKILSFIEKFRNYIFIITGVLIFISIYLVFSTLKLIINSKYKELETMKLVGAKLSTIKMPIIFNGIFIGLFSGLLSAGLFLLILKYFKHFLDLTYLFGTQINFYLLAVFLLGPLLGLLVSFFSLRKISLKI
jgi:cell division transport system permease protein